MNLHVLVCFGVRSDWLDASFLIGNGKLKAYPIHALFV